MDVSEQLQEIYGTNPNACALWEVNIPKGTNDEFIQLRIISCNAGSFQSPDLPSLKWNKGGSATRRRSKYYALENKATYLFDSEIHEDAPMFNLRKLIKVLPDIERKLKPESEIIPIKIINAILSLEIT